MRNLFGALVFAAVLFAQLWTGAQTGGPDISARALIAMWKAPDRSATMIAEVIASAFASGMSAPAALGEKPIYCPPTDGTFNGRQVMTLLAGYITANPDAAAKPYGFALSASLRRAFPCRAHVQPPQESE